jgi:hypothetical protein
VSKRPIIEKKANRVRKAVSRKQLPAYVDLFRWLKLHGYAQTSGECRKLILDKRLKSDSHTIGLQKQGDKTIVDRYAPASVRSGLSVSK